MRSRTRVIRFQEPVGPSRFRDCYANLYVGFRGVAKKKKERKKKEEEEERKTAAARK